MQIGDVGKRIYAILQNCFKQIEQLYGAEITEAIQKIHEIDQEIAQIQKVNPDSKSINQLEEDAEMYEFSVADILEEEKSKAILGAAERECNAILQEVYGSDYKFEFDGPGGQSVGIYVPQTKTVSISPYNVFLRLFNSDKLDYQQLSGFIEHEISHLLQYKHNKHGSEKRFNNYLQGLANIRPGEYDSRETLYLNFPLERQAFMSNIVNELSHLRPSLDSFDSFINFINQSEQWVRMSKVLYPENRANMIRGLYKYYSSLAEPTTGSPAPSQQYSTNNEHDQTPF